MRVAARTFAVRAHGDQRYGPFPYQYHLAQVEAAVDEFCAELDGPLDHESIAAAAWLHDVLEDTGATIQQLHDNFGMDVTMLVVTVTDSPGRNRKERHAATYPRIRNAGFQAVGLKLCDRLANLRACRELGNDRMRATYRDEFQYFHETLHRDGELPCLWAALRDLL